jgi:predicted nucleic acid-binding protein
MIAVSNTSPICYLILTEQEHLFSKLFATVYVPGAVHEELTNVNAPQRVRRLVESAPPYEVREVRGVLPVHAHLSLHAGEQQALMLAEILKPDIVLIDDQAGRTAAIHRGLPVTGTLGVLERADRLGLIIDFPGLLIRLKESGFFISGSITSEMLMRHRERHGSK